MEKKKPKNLNQCKFDYIRDIWMQESFPLCYNLWLCCWKNFSYITTCARKNIVNWVMIMGLMHVYEREIIIGNDTRENFSQVFFLNAGNCENSRGEEVCGTQKEKSIKIVTVWAPFFTFTARFIFICVQACKKKRKISNSTTDRVLFFFSSCFLRKYGRYYDSCSCNKTDRWSANELDESTFSTIIGSWPNFDKTN